MEGIELRFQDEALSSISKKAIERKTGARGLRSIMEGILLDTMFELPGLDGVEEVVISREVVEGRPSRSSSTRRSRRRRRALETTLRLGPASASAVRQLGRVAEQGGCVS